MCRTGDRQQTAHQPFLGNVSKCAGLSSNEGGLRLGKGSATMDVVYLRLFLCGSVFISVCILSLFLRVKPSVIIPHLVLKNQDQGQTKQRKQQRWTKHPGLKGKLKLNPLLSTNFSIITGAFCSRLCRFEAVSRFKLFFVFTNVFRQPWLYLRQLFQSKKHTAFCSIRCDDPWCHHRVWSGADFYLCLLCRWPMRVIWNTCGAQCVGCFLISGPPVQGRKMALYEKKV